MKKSILVQLFSIVVVATGLVILSSPVLAQAPPLPPPPGGGSVAVPLDGFSWLFILGGIGLGYKSLSDRSE